MKTCLICTAPDESGERETCAFCGEASWSEPEAPAPEAPATPSAAPKSKKGGAK